MIAALLVLLTGVISLSLTERLRAYALRHDLLDQPNERSSHSVPIPRGGGLALVAAALIALMVGATLHRVSVQHAVALAPGMILLGFVGWLDDRSSLSVSARLAAHFLAAAMLLGALGGLPDIQIGTASLHIGIAGSLLAAIGIAWSISLFNFMDGIDGLAASQAVLIFGTAGVLFSLRGEDSLTVSSLCFAAAAAGFLYWNTTPARVFMGEASGTVGFMIAGLAVAGENTHSVPILAFAILGGVFVGDATMTLVRRVLRGARPTEAHRDHAYQRLARARGSHRSVMMAAAICTLVLAALAAAATLRPALTGVAFLVSLLFLAGLAVAVERRSPM